MQEYDYSSLCNEALVISLRKKVIHESRVSRRLQPCAGFFLVL